GDRRSLSLREYVPDPGVHIANRVQHVGGVAGGEASAQVVAHHPAHLVDDGVEDVTSPGLFAGATGIRTGSPASSGRTSGSAGITHRGRHLLDLHQVAHRALASSATRQRRLRTELLVEAVETADRVEVLHVGEFGVFREGREMSRDRVAELATGELGEASRCSQPDPLIAEPAGVPRRLVAVEVPAYPADRRGLLPGGAGLPVGSGAEERVTVRPWRPASTERHYF